MSSLYIRFSAVLSVVALSAYLVTPSIFPHSFPSKKKIGLGLDLVGGSYVLMNVDFDSYLDTKLTGLIPEITQQFNDSNYKKLGLLEHEILVFFSSKQDCEINIQKLKKPDTNMYAKCSLKKMHIGYSSSAKKTFLSNVLEESISNIKRRLDSYGTKEVSVQSQGSQSILVQVPGVYEINAVKSLIGTTAKLSFHLVSDSDNNFKNGQNIISLNDENGKPYSLLAKSEFGGDSLVAVSPSQNKFGKFAVSFKLNSIGSKKFANLTKANVGKQLAIVLDQSVISAPVINEPIVGGSGEISGDFTFEKAKNLSLMLNSGSLPATVNIISERAIDATLGSESIKNGKYALIISLLLVSSSMIFMYGLFGIFAVISLLCNILIIFACLIISNSTLTLPGLAGIALTMGMAVDANILIFERIKEYNSLHKGKKLFGVIRSGFQGAMSTIIDSNVTTLMAAGVMSALGSGSVRGFALTLSIGIFCSMFSSIFITKLMIDFWLKRSAKGEVIIT